MLAMQVDMIVRAERVLLPPARLDFSRHTLLGAKHVMITAHPTVAGVTFKDIVGFPGYCVGDDGSVWSRQPRNGRGPFGPWRELKQSTIVVRHRTVVLYKDCKTKKALVHRLVLEAFVGPCPEGMEARHFPDRNPLNNRLSNLQWGTRKENQADKLVHGTHIQGEKYWSAKLTEADVIRIRTLAANGVAKPLLAKQFNIANTNIHQIIKRLVWKHVP